VAWLQGDAGASAPQYVKTVMADKVVALYVANAISSALYAREKSGIGQAVEVPMFECMVSFLAVEHLAGKTFVPPEGGTGYSRLLNEFRRPFRTLDGYIGVVPYTDGQWKRFFELAGEPSMASIRASTQSARSRHFTELYAFLTPSRRPDHRLTCCKPPTSLLAGQLADDLLDDPHLNALLRRRWRLTEGTFVQTACRCIFAHGWRPATRAGRTPMNCWVGDAPRARSKKT
jgi:crotonobetainyl-CoA:carnitine CoA-transferase CaiB-like acyl-CoA transferase